MTLPIRYIPVAAAVRPTRRWLLAALVMTLAGGCVSTTGLPEFRAYQSAFDQAFAASTQILDELAVAERAAALRLIAAGRDPVTQDPPTPRSDPAQLRSDGFDPQFYVVDSVYETGLGDPPGTAAIRRALATVADFNNLLLAYGEGRGLDELKAQASAVAAEGTAAAGAAALALGTPLAIPALPAALGLVNEGLDVALRAASRAAFRDALVARAPDIDAILEDVRDTAPTVFSLLTRDVANRAKDLRDDGRDAEAAEAVARIDAYRKLLSNWVLMLEQTQAALAATVAAVTGPPDQVGRLSDLAQSATELRARSARIGALLVDLRRGTPPV
jgi:hypothetical protein